MFLLSSFKKPFMRFTSLFIPGSFLVVCLGLGAQSTRPSSLPSTPPRIFFSDLESGPNISGQKNQGAWVTIWGKGFGAERGSSTVTICGGAAEYPISTDTKITFQLGPAARTGDIVMSVQEKVTRAASNAGSSGGPSNKSVAETAASRSGSNGLPFTIRAGKIYFVAVNGSDRQKGSFEAPWKTIVQAKDRMSAGDVTYIRDGVAQTSEDSYTAYLSMDRGGGSNSGKPGAPKALVAYPGARVTIGKAHGLGVDFGIRTPNIAAREDWWVISQLRLIWARMKRRSELE
jgi:IPT/TIG domain-containing protein